MILRKSISKLIIVAEITIFRVEFLLHYNWATYAYMQILVNWIWKAGDIAAEASDSSRKSCVQLQATVSVNKMKKRQKIVLFSKILKMLSKNRFIYKVKIRQFYFLKQTCLLP